MYSSFFPAESLSSRRRALAGLFVLAVLLLSVTILPSASSSSSSDAAVAAFLPKLKKLFEFKPPVPVAPPSQTIKIVSEESQVIAVVKNASDAVVSIIASADVPKVVQCRQQLPQIQGLPPEFQNMFDVPALCQNGTEHRRVGAGSGFIVSPDGYIVTNRHVVENEQGDYTVVLNDQKHLGQKMKATVLARDAQNDIAILKVDGRDLPFLGLGDSSRLQVGQTAIAIGYALGQFDNTVSKGVVSGLFRSISASSGASSEDLRGLIQTDAAINPGNSGGPLLDIGGNVIGMNTAVANAQSIGFAIPINTIHSDYDQVRANGKISEELKAYLGVRYQAVTSETQTAKHLPYDYGMLIGKGDQITDVAVLPGSPADKAGIKEGDILLEADGRQLNERYLLSDVVAAHHPGEVIHFKLFHAGDIKMVDVTLEKKP